MKKFLAEYISVWKTHEVSLYWYFKANANCCKCGVVRTTPRGNELVTGKSFYQTKFGAMLRVRQLRAKDPTTQYYPVIIKLDLIS